MKGEITEKEDRLVQIIDLSLKVQQTYKTSLQSIQKPRDSKLGEGRQI